MAIFTFATAKGGAGKTTAAAGLGAELALRGFRVGFVDADPNLHLLDWHRLGGLPQTSLSPATGETVLDVIDAVAAASDHVVVDLEGAASQLVLQAVIKSDLVLIPTQLSNMDIKEAQATAAAVRRAERIRGRSIPCAYVVTRMPPLRSRLASHLQAELTGEGEGPRRLPGLPERVVWREMMNHGVPPQRAGDDAGPRAASRDIAALADAALAMVAPADDPRPVGETP